MLTVVTNRDSNHLTPRIDPVPIGTIDAYGRDDGWIGDRPADCGNFWIPRGNVEDPPYISSDVMTMTPGVGSFLGSIWLGGTDVAVAFDVYTGPDLSSTKYVNCYFVAADRPEFGVDPGVEQIIVQLFSTISRLQLSTAGALTDVATGSGSSPSTAYRIYVSAHTVPGGWFARVDRSNTDGTGRVLVCAGIVSCTATMGWLSFATGSPMTAVTIDNVERTAVGGGYYTTDFAVDGIGAGWTADQGSWATGSNGAYSTTGNDSDALTRDFGQADMVVRVTFAAIPAGVGGGLYARYADSNNYYLLEIDQFSNLFYITKRVAGTFTTIAGTSSYTFAAGDLFELSALGDTIQATIIRGGSTWATLSATDSSLTTGTRAGIRTSYNSASGVRFADFTVYG